MPSAPTEILPILPLRNSVLFPASVVPVNVGRPKSVRLIEEVVERERPTIAVVAQKRLEIEDPVGDDLYPVGTAARLLKVIRLSSGNYSVVLQGVGRVRILGHSADASYLTARIDRVDEVLERDAEIDALTTHLRETARGLTGLLPQHAPEAASMLENVQHAGALADLIASNLPVSISAKQDVLETFDLRERLRKVLALVQRQSQVHQVRKEIATMVQDEMSRSQRELLLRQQLRAIRIELGEGDDEEDEIDALRQRIVEGNLPVEAEKAAKRQLSRMRMMAPASAEFHVCRSYVEWIADLPWQRSTPDRMDVAEARRVLDEDHHGLERPKRRILEYIAVRRLRADKRGPILCFVGPPGVGKTSLARSIARATGRNFTRIALGGVQDEAEIRGHRRTYVGSYPGRVVAAFKQAGARNPVMLLDEVDKLGNDYRGDPASALLEVLDPEQNSAFIDHYLEVPVDCSRVMFIATANRRDTIPAPLLDRMELIEIPGYTREEKRIIAKQFVIPRQLAEHGLTPDRLELSDDAIDLLIDEYTNEAGVRKLEQKVASACRSVAVRLAEGEDIRLHATPETIRTLLGAPSYTRESAERQAAVGVSTGLAWTPAGGDLLFVEASRMPGSGHVHLTGQMGSVMKESVAAALTYIRARAASLGLAPDFLSTIDVHVHLPQGAVPKDGPSAGIAIFTALVSMLTQIKVRPNVAMTGEITLRGNILKVAGLKEKCLAAHRAGIETVLLPRQNEPDLDDIPAEILAKLDIRLVSKVTEVADLVLELDDARAA